MPMFQGGSEQCETIRIAAMAAIAAREFTPARPGTYHDPARTRHEKDRDAKWGTSPGRPGCCLTPLALRLCSSSSLFFRAIFFYELNKFFGGFHDFAIAKSDGAKEFNSVTLVAEAFNEFVFIFR